MAKKDPDYWKRRMAALEDVRYREGAAYYKDVQEQFRRASNSIQMDIERWYMRLAGNNDISYAAAKRLLKKGELEEFKWDVQQYIKAGEENAIDRRWMKELENASARYHISYLEAMKLQTRQHAELLSTEFEGGMTDFLHKSYSDSYYHTAYEMAKGTGVGTNLARLDSKRIDTVIQKPWAQDGANFSDRIWSNKQKLIQNLHTELSQNIIRGESPQKAIDNLTKTMNVSRAQAGRLIMTESAAIASVAQRDSLKELGVEQYEILATLDSKTSEICQSLDGQVFDMKDYEVGVTAPPFHPNCRSTTVPYFDDEFTDGEERAARDEGTGKTYYVPADMKYGEWKRRFVPKTTEPDGIAFKKRSKKRSKKELEDRGSLLKKEIEEATGKDSCWSGNIKVDNEACEKDGCLGEKLWNCDILLRDDVSDHTLIHELIHSCSISHYGPEEYIGHGKIEEASVELLSQELCQTFGLEFDTNSYADEVTVLRSLNSGLGMFETDFEFAKNLISQSAPDRFAWLQEQVGRSIMDSEEMSLEDAGEIMDFLDKLRGGLNG